MKADCCSVQMGALSCLMVLVSVCMTQSFGADWICRLADWKLAGGSLLKRMFLFVFKVVMDEDRNVHAEKFFKYLFSIKNTDHIRPLK